MVLILVSALACFKQSPPPVESDYVDGVSDQTRLDACSELDFNNDFLSHSNVKNLFLCTKWNEQFKSLYGGIVTINSESWDFMTNPISRNFFDNHERRDQIIRYLKELDEEQSLDDLGHVLSGINEINFYTGLKELLLCIEGIAPSYCRGINNNKVTRDDIVNIGKLITQEKKQIEATARIIESFAVVSRDRQENLRVAISQANSSDSIKDKRVDLLNAILLKYQDGIDEVDKTFLSKLFEIKNGDSFFFDFLNSSDQTIEDVETLIKYFATEDSGFFNDIVILSEVLKAGVGCDSEARNRYFKFSFQQEIKKFDELVSKYNRDEVFDYLIDRALLLRAGEQFCPALRSVDVRLPIYAQNQGLDHNLNFLRLIERTGNYIENQNRFKMASFLASITTDKNKSEFESGYIVSLLADRISLALHGVNLDIVKHSPRLHQEIVRLAMSLPKDFFIDLEDMAMMSIADKNISSLKSSYKAYQFFNNKERSFLFNFMDRHFDEGVNFVALTRFYSKLLYEFSDVVGDFSQSWFEDEGFYEALKNFAIVFAGEEILSDFRRFYSRDHIIEVIRVITNGAELKARAQRERRYYRTADYLDTSRRMSSGLEINLNGSSLNLECIGNITTNNLYQLVEDFPSSCKKESGLHLSISFLSWLSKIQKEYSRRFNIKEGIFNQSGVISPRLLGEYTVALKISSEKNILELTLKNLFDHLIRDVNSKGDIGHIDDVEGVLSGIIPAINAVGRGGEQYRNAILKSLSLQDASRIQDYLSSVEKILRAYSNFLNDKRGLLTETQIPSTKTCDRFLNQNIGYNCPKNSSEIVRVIKQMIVVLFKDHARATSNLFEAVYDAFRAPQNSGLSQRYRLSFNETIQMLVGKTDKTKQINNLKIPYVRRGRDSEIMESMTTMERIEVVIRDVRFGRNYLGVQYMNYVAFGDDYNKNVENRKQTLSNCIVIPVVRCGKKMSKDERRMGENALKAFDGLLDANNGRGLESSFNYGKYMKALLGVVVTSSSREAQTVRLLPLSDDVLRGHNGVFLGLLTEIAAFSNIGRWIQSRLIANDMQLEDLIGSYGTQFLDRHFLKNVDHVQMKRYLTKVLENTIKEQHATDSVLKDITEFIWNSDVEQLVRLESLLMKATVIAHHLGEIDNISGLDTIRYAENSTLDLLKLIDFIVENWNPINASLPTRFNTMEQILSFSEFIDYLYLGLESEETRMEFYVFLNESFLILKEVLLTPYPSIGSEDSETISGLTILKSIYSDTVASRELSEGVLILNEYFSNQKKYIGLERDWYKSIAGFLGNIILDERFDIQPMLDFLAHTTKPSVCDESGFCIENQHYDFPHRAIEMSLERKGNSSRLKSGALHFDKHLESILEYLEEIAQSVMLVDEPVQ